MTTTTSNLRFADLELNPETREVSRAGRRVPLTATEFRLLRCFVLHPGRVLTRAQLLEHVWQYDFGGDAHVLETYISCLRKKLRPHGPQLIHTLRGVGYALREPQPDRGGERPGTTLSFSRRGSDKAPPS